MEYWNSGGVRRGARCMFANLDLAAHKARLRNDDDKCTKRSGSSFDDTLGANVSDETGPTHHCAKKSKGSARVATSGGRRTAAGGGLDDGSDDEYYYPTDNGPVGSSSGLSCIMRAGMKVNPPAPCEAEEPDLDSDDHEHVREFCYKPMHTLKTFKDVHGAWKAKQFAEQYEPVSRNGMKCISGLLLFGPSGTGKTHLAEAIASHVAKSYYTITVADLPSGTAGGRRIDALFQVALAGELPAVIFLDECDSLLSEKAAARVGHFAKAFGRYMDNILVIGATNDPQRIAKKILDGRFERKILVDNPDSDARKSLIMTQLHENTCGKDLTPTEMSMIVEKTKGRSAVNIQRLVSTAISEASMEPVMLAHFESAMLSERSDFNKATARANRKYDEQYGWNPSPA